MDFTRKTKVCHEYVEALEVERRKIQMFQRELPLCLELVTHAIEACRRELSGTMTMEYMHGQTECSEQTMSEGGPVLEEFMPIRRTSSSAEDEEESHKPNNNKDKTSSNADKKKSDWLRSVQLWNQSPDPLPKEDEPKHQAAMEVKRNGGAFQPFHKENTVAKAANNGNSQQQAAKAKPSVPATAVSSTSGDKKEDKEGQQTQRKQRRCWSPELHRRFLHALQQLGGSHAATPKQIRELMKVDGLTNDEVKSHLQKYRLHTRRPSPTVRSNGNPQAPQLLVVGGIWVPAVAATTASGEAVGLDTVKGIYAPVAAPPSSAVAAQSSGSLTQKLQKQTQYRQVQSEERGSHSEGAVNSNSPSTSSSTHTSTASPVF